MSSRADQIIQKLKKSDDFGTNKRYHTVEEFVRDGLKLSRQCLATGLSPLSREEIVSLADELGIK